MSTCLPYKSPIDFHRVVCSDVLCSPVYLVSQRAASFASGWWVHPQCLLNHCYCCLHSLEQGSVFQIARWTEGLEVIDLLVLWRPLEKDSRANGYDSGERMGKFPVPRVVLAVHGGRNAVSMKRRVVTRRTLLWS